jgi:hypothetical protein
MRVMRLTRSSRSTVALLTAILLLLCQTAFAANACAHGGVAASIEAMSAPCHTPENGGSAPMHDAPDASGGCAVSQALADPAKIPVLAATDLPAVVVAYPLAADAAVHARAPARVAAVCASPPLTILHCRFLN